MSAAGSRRSWDYPDCPDCESDVLVELERNGSTAYCWGCGTRFGREVVAGD